MLHTIIEEKLYDEQYIQAQRLGLRGAEGARSRISRPRRWPRSAASTPRPLRDVARTYAKAESSIIFWGMGISQHTHGTDNSRCLIALALITGQVGRPGTGLHPLRGQNNVQGASDVGLIPMYFPDYKSVENPDIRGRYENFWGQTLDPKRGLTVVEIIDAIHAGEHQGHVHHGREPGDVGSRPDTMRAPRSRMLEHLVVQDIFLTETAWHADVVLPASAHAEKLGTYTNTNRQVQIGRPALDLPGDARQDWELIVDLAKRLGLDWNYRPHLGRLRRDGPGHALAEAHLLGARRRARTRSSTRPTAPDVPGNEIVFTTGFPTADGRGRIVPADLLPPDEVPDAEYPLVLTTGRMLEHWHTGAMTRRAGVLDAIEPQGIAAMNPHEIAAPRALDRRHDHGRNAARHASRRSCAPTARSPTAWCSCRSASTKARPTASPIRCSTRSARSRSSSTAPPGWRRCVSWPAKRGTDRAPRASWLRPA